MQPRSENEGPTPVLDVINDLNDEQDRLGYTTSMQILLGMLKHMEIHWGELIHSVVVRNCSLEELETLFLFLKEHTTQMVNMTMTFDESTNKKEIIYLKEKDKSELDIA